MSAPKPVVFLDRDGVINEPPGAERYIRRWEAFRFREGALRMLADLASMGYRLVVITNQQGVGKGLIEPDELERIHANMSEVVERHGARIDGIFCCPHLEAEGCDCRKPKPGLIFDALEALDCEVDLNGSWFVGDSATDVQAGQAAGLRTLLVGGPAGGAAHPSPTARVERVSEIALELRPSEQSTTRNNP